MKHLLIFYLCLFGAGIYFFAPRSTFSPPKASGLSELKTAGVFLNGWSQYREF
ncbi:MAG: hypothetical protein H7296_02615 [Bacteroidia bacterium]|nr:hypothetical protein [Bacteroidia bacterium]